MPKSKRNDPCDQCEDYQQLDIVAINANISQVSKDIESSILDRLEKGLDTRFEAMTKKLTDAISGKQPETRREGHNQKRRKKCENVDEEYDKEESDSKEEVGPAASEEEQAEDHTSTGKDKQVSEKVKGPNKVELYAAMSKLLEEADLEMFKVDLRGHRKAEAKQIIDNVMKSMFAEDDEPQEK